MSYFRINSHYYHCIVTLLKNNRTLSNITNFNNTYKTHHTNSNINHNISYKINHNISSNINWNQKSIKHYLTQTRSLNQTKNSKESSLIMERTIKTNNSNFHNTNTLMNLFIPN